MKRKSKSFLLLSVIALLIITAFSCSLFSALPDYAGEEVKVDKDTGFFKEDMTYKRASPPYTYEYSFKADGTYEYIRMYWNSTDEEWEHNSGLKGTYSWDPDTLVLNKIYTKLWDNTAQEYFEPASYPYEVEYLSYFTTTNYYGEYEVYKQDETDETVWTATYSSSYEDTSKYSETVSFTYNEDAMTFSYTESSTESYEGEFTDKDESESSGTIISVFPEDTKFKRGNTVTVTMSGTSKSRDWDPVDDWYDWSTPSTYQDSQTMLHMGDFIIMNPTTESMRTLEF